VDGTHVYWTGGLLGDGSVRRTPKTGGATEELASTLASPHGLAVDTTCVYWTNGDDGTIMRAPK
jgi:hypothetical protein